MGLTSGHMDGVLEHAELRFNVHGSHDSLDIDVLVAVDESWSRAGIKVTRSAHPISCGVMSCRVVVVVVVEHCHAGVCLSRLLASLPVYSRVVCRR